jgi:hypothetical protein
MKAANKFAQILIEVTWGLFGCRLLPLLLCLTALSASPETSNAQQIYVAGSAASASETIGVCNASLEGAFSGNFIRTNTEALAIMGNTLFVGTGNVVASYNATTGATLNVAFITASGFFGISALAISGNTLFVAYVRNLGGNFIGAYNATTGEAINANLILLPDTPASVATSGGTLFVDMFNTIWSYNGVTGAVIKANLVTGLSGAIAVSGDTLVVANATGTIATYNAKTGLETNPDFITASPSALAISGNTLFVEEQHVISSYDLATGNPIASSTQSQYYFSRMTVGGTSANPNVMNFGIVPAPWRVETVGDFNGDGHSDVVFANTTYSAPARLNPFGDLRHVWYLNDGALSSTSTFFPSASSVPGPPWRIAGAEDFNGDGDTDIVWENTSTGQHAIWLLEGSRFTNGIILPAVAPPWRIAGVGDFNKDGNADIVWENTSTGQRAIWLLVNGVYSSAIRLPTVVPQWRIAGVGDFDNDGYPDLLWENTTTGQHAIWFLNNGAFSSSLILPTVPPPWRVVGVGDFNADGNADIMFQNENTGQILAWMLKNGAFLFQ